MPASIFSLIISSPQFKRNLLYLFLLLFFHPNPFLVWISGDSSLNTTLVIFTKLLLLFRLSSSVWGIPFYFCFYNILPLFVYLGGNNCLCNHCVGLLQNPWSFLFILFFIYFALTLPFKNKKRINYQLFSSLF